MRTYTKNHVVTKHEADQPKIVRCETCGEIFTADDNVVKVYFGWREDIVCDKQCAQVYKYERAQKVPFKY